MSAVLALRSAHQQSCRFCQAPLSTTFCDLGMSPLSNANRTAEQLGEAETFYPLKAYVCQSCWLVQLPEHEAPAVIFATDYPYFSSGSSTWLSHAKAYVSEVSARFGLGKDSQVVEIGSNDGYLLQYFAERDVPCLGIEPARNCALVAQDKGVDTLVEFFGKHVATVLARRGKRADLIIGNNVLAHVPDLNDFVAGLKVLLKPHGVVTMEFPHLLKLMQGRQFDTIYHEHYSYFSLAAAERVFASHGLEIFDVQELPTHGGSLRIYAQHASGAQPMHLSVAKVRADELAYGLEGAQAYERFARGVCEVKYALLDLLIRLRRDGKRVWGYGAPAKGNTLLNYCGIRSDMLECTVDTTPAKQGKFLPGTHIPILAPEAVNEARPDILLILAWNWREEMVARMTHIRQWGGRFMVAIPHVEILV